MYWDIKSNRKRAETTNREPVGTFVVVVGVHVVRIQVEVTSVIRSRRVRRRRPIVTSVTLIVDFGIVVITVTSEREKSYVMAECCNNLSSKLLSLLLVCCLLMHHGIPTVCRIKTSKTLKCFRIVKALYLE